MTKTATATDALGNTGSGSVTVKLDKAAPTIGASSSPAPNAFGWNNTHVTVTLTCLDGLSGIKSCTGGGSVTLKAEGDNQTLAASAVDNADNNASTSVGPIRIDKTAPALTGAPTSSPNAAGWYKGDVTIHWTASDALSGVDPATVPADSVVGGEGAGLTVGASVRDKAGNEQSASSSPVKIDRTAPSTDAVAPAGWQSSDAAVTLGAADNLSGVASTHYVLDAGVEQSGTSVAIDQEGVHTLQYWSEDAAGNVEPKKSVEVKVDKTAPSISAFQTPLANGNGWNNTDVQVHFECTDSLSGIASCTADQVVATEGQDQGVDGTAVDNAGNSASASASVSVDKSDPSVSATRSPAPNGAGWNDGDVTVSFSCDDVLSGVALCRPRAARTATAGTRATSSSPGRAATPCRASPGAAPQTARSRARAAISPPPRP
ncbi:MAG: hypothetical protein LC779_07915 [Actinobacteria bacterium]|nr:hypothetical protein [Actinomycetota bacterium]